MSFDELTSKYRHAAKLAISEEAIDSLVAAVKRLETVPDMNELVRLALKP
jgi:hypothetical protein